MDRNVGMETCDAMRDCCCCQHAMLMATYKHGKAAALEGLKYLLKVKTAFAMSQKPA